MKKILAVALGGLLLAGAIAIAQTNPLYRWIGTETLRITLNSGTGVTIDLNSVHNTVGVSSIGAGTTVNVSPSGAIPTVGNLVATGAITTWNVSLPNPSNHGQKVCLSNGTGSDFTTNTNVGAGTGTQTQTMNTGGTATGITIAAGTSRCWVFQMTSNTAGTWYRVQ